MKYLLLVIVGFGLCVSLFGIYKAATFRPGIDKGTHRMPPR